MHLELLSRLPADNAHPTPVLFVHGAWHAAWCWDEHFLPYFAAHGYEAHALSLRGHGSSSGSYRLARSVDYVADVAHVAAALHRSPVIIGHSMGGYIVQKYLERHAAPAGVLLASVPVSGAFGFIVRSLRRQPLDAVRATLSFDLHTYVETQAKARYYFFAEDMPAEDVRRYAARIQGESYRIVLDGAALDLPRPERVRTPMLVIGAGKDTVFMVEEVIATAQAYRVTPHFIAGAAHDLMLDARWQQSADIIVEWLASQGI